ncbi:hypothetical protein OUZ56_002986 [Daphnia magna]|uniref:Uncharacterized protein n=1 Tax=Daphnia magna TaxID=35525 RepID=A0ABR0A7C8_9CRUS|nr:hypothetical protein OUZ56_002986 [Daphnia magna]
MDERQNYRKGYGTFFALSADVMALSDRFSGRVPARQHRHHSTDNKHVGTQPVNHQFFFWGFSWSSTGAVTAHDDDDDDDDYSYKSEDGRRRCQVTNDQSLSLRVSKIFDATHTQLFQYNRRNDYRKAKSKKLTFSANANVAYGQFKVTLSSEIYTREIEVENDSHVAVGSEEKDKEVVLECHGGFRVVASVGEGHENKKKQAIHLSIRLHIVR